MIEGTKKMELDAKEGREYSSGIRLRDVGKNGDSEEKKSKKKARTGEPNNNQLTRRTAREQCKCGGDDHKRISSSRCPWKGLSKEEVTQNYEKRMSEIVVPQNCDEKTVVPTTELTSGATEKEKRESGDCEEHVQSTSKYFGASSENTK
jgi:hypothetical protein